MFRARPGLEAAAWARLDVVWASDIQGPSPSRQAGLQARASGSGPGLKYIFPQLRSWGRHRQFHSYAKRIESFYLTTPSIYELVTVAVAVDGGDGGRCQST
ncbi:hypothetical protein B0H17DRAFT_1150309 [Mycena rosella]|uniref:Uncharacterized protein n=1 Tax=Mycena rosella TaxID=1033263 RepID=A0AAD7FLZ3_MYCRO|nr:hypothetical protein B0H17DRAFT_1150309 [Mycena rosella]